jgi:Putative MetA-pathway of phenol degradation
MRKPLVIAAALGAAIASSPSQAIDYFPLDWVPVPRGTQVLALYYEDGEHDSYSNTTIGTFSDNTSLDSHIGLARYIHYSKSSLFGHQWDWNVILPFGSLRDGRIGGQSLGNASGVGDPIASIGYFAIDNPEHKRYLTFAPYITIPIGSYDRNKPLNLGGNRWIYNFQGDFTQGIGEKLTLDLSAGWTWYGDNNEAGNGSQRLTQETSYELYGWLIYDVTNAVRHAWQGASNAKLSLGYMGLFGGEQKIDGVPNGQKARQDQLRLAYMMNFSPTFQGLISVSHDVHVEGQFEENFGLNLRFMKAF